MLRAVALALLLAVAGFALADEPTYDNALTLRYKALDNLVVSYERMGYFEGGFEGGFVFDLEYIKGDFTVYPVFLFGWFPENFGLWVELTPPEGYVPFVGKGPEWFTIGTQVRW